MGKYAVIHHDSDMNEEGDSVFLLQAIANELAEANRLKRLELDGYSSTTSYVDGPLEDKA